MLSSLLAGATLLLTRKNLLEEREAAALDEVFEDALFVKDVRPSDLETVLEDAQLGRNFVVLSRELSRSPADTVPFASKPEVFNREHIPASLKDTVGALDAALIRTKIDGARALIVGVPLIVGDRESESIVEFYEEIPLDDIQDTLRSLSIILWGTAGATTLLGAVLGWWAARRTVRPLGDVAAAAEAIAGGRLDTRLIPPADRELALLTTAFNDMAGALQERIERDARFASEVSHELRSPLMTLTASVEVLETRKDELPERAQVAVELLASDLERFRQLVEDLLEISRFDVGTARLELDDLNVVEFTRQAVSRASSGALPIEYPPSMSERIVRADKRRLARVLFNLVENAQKYGDGATRVELSESDSTVQIAVEDSGPGVPADERSVIFDRFSRGSAGGRRGSDSGVGLGLSLVTEHVHLHGGRVWVEDRPDGEPGARFVVELPVDPAKSEASSISR